MSLVLTAMPWSGSGTRKRTSTIQRMKKNATRREAPIKNDYDDVDDAEYDIDNSDLSESFTSSMADQQSRNEKVTKILDKITSAGDGLADFKPLASPDDMPAKNPTLEGLLPAISRHEGVKEGFQAPLYYHDYNANGGETELLSNYAQSYKPYYSQQPQQQQPQGGNVMQN